MLFYFGYARDGNLHWSGKFIWTLKLHESFTCFTYPWNLSHFIIISVLVFCNGLTPFNGYALRTFFTRKKGIDMPHVRFSWKAAPSIIVVDKRWLSALDGLFYNKGAPYSHAHNQTLMIMMNLGERNLSHTFIATSCPFQLCSRNWPVKMSKWSWQLWWWAIWGKWDQNNDEVADDVDADDINVCKAISFLGRFLKRF